MNAFWIKVIAIIAMLVDHFALIYFPHSFPLQLLGRVSYPLIAWLIANGAIHTRDINRYLRRLFIFAVIAQIPIEFVYAWYGSFHLFFNVLFTLFFGLLAIRCLQTTWRPVLQWMCVLGCIVGASLMHTDYGAGGVLSIIAFYVFFNRPMLMIASQVVVLAILTNLSFFIAPGFGSALFMHPLEKYALIALPLILLYNGKRGPAGFQYWFYWFFVVQEVAYMILQYYRQ